MPGVYFRCNRDRPGYYEEIQNIFGTVYRHLCCKTPLHGKMIVHIAVMFFKAYR